MSDPLVEGRANVRVSRAEKARMEAFVVGSLETYRRMTLWTWVGGTVSLGEATLRFRPNALNLAIEHGDHPLSGGQPFTIEIPLTAVTDVSVTSGPFTRIHLRTVRGTLSLRCPGARELAEAIRTSVRSRAATG